LIERHTQRPDARGAVRKHSMREIINAILYVSKTGCQWRMLPSHFPPWFTVYNHFWRMQARSIWQQITLELNRQSRKKKGGSPLRVTSSSTRKRSKPTTKAKPAASMAARKSKGVAGKSP
jgi:transposase